MMYKCCQNQTSDHKSQQRKHPFFIILFRLSPQSAPDLVRFNKLSYILSHLFPFDNLSFFHFSENFPLIYIPNILPNMLMEKGKITSHAPFTALRAVSWTAGAV